MGSISGIFMIYSDVFYLFSTKKKCGKFYTRSSLKWLEMHFKHNLFSIFLFFESVENDPFWTLPPNVEFSTLLLFFLTGSFNMRGTIYF